jgi:hypothetical protein
MCMNAHACRCLDVAVFHACNNACHNCTCATQLHARVVRPFAAPCSAGYEGGAFMSIPLVMKKKEEKKKHMDIKQTREG